MSEMTESSCSISSAVLRAREGSVEATEASSPTSTEGRAVKPPALWNRTVQPVPDVHPTEPLTKYNLARVLLHRAPVDSGAAQFVKQHRTALRELVTQYQRRSD